MIKTVTCSSCNEGFVTITTRTRCLKCTRIRAEALEEAVGAIEKLKNHTAIEPHTSRFIILNLVLSAVKELNHDR